MGYPERYYAAIATDKLGSPKAGTNMGFEIISEITNIEIIAVGSSIRQIDRLRKVYGNGRWRKLKGIATISLEDGFVCRAEIHWYEAHGIGKKEMKIKSILD